MRTININILLVFVLVTSCYGPYIISSIDLTTKFRKIDFCELNQIESGALIEITTFYSGIEEYWGLTSNGKCNLDNDVYLNIDEITKEKGNGSLAKEFQNLYDNYEKYSLKLKIHGKVEKTNSELGYGHLGLKRIQIISYQIEILGKKAKSKL